MLGDERVVGLSNMRIEISNVEAELVVNVEHDRTIVASVEMIIKTASVAVNDSLSDLVGAHRGSHVVDNAHHLLVRKIRVLVNNSSDVDLSVIDQLFLSFIIVTLNMLDSSLERVTEVSLNNFPGFFIVVDKTLISRFNSDTHGDKSGKVTSLTSDLISHTSVVSAISISLVENSHHVAVEETRVSIDGVQDTVSSIGTLSTSA